MEEKHYNGCLFGLLYVYEYDILHLCTIVMLYIYIM